MQLEASSRPCAPWRAWLGDDVIAGILNRNGLTAGNGNRRTLERATSTRTNHQISVYREAENGVEPWRNLSEAASSPGIAKTTLRLTAGRPIAAPQA